MKNAIKEIFIMLLLCIAIALILAVVFYDYNPINKEIPKTIEYQMPSELSEVKEEIDTPLTSSEEQQVIRTYEVTQDDLNSAKKTKNYDAGKANPFMAYSDNTTTDGNTTNSNSNASNNSNLISGSSNSQENYMGNKAGGKN